MSNIFIAGNFTPPTTAAPVKVSTGTAIKTLLQIAVPSTINIRIVEWGISFDGSAAATPIEVELFGTTVAATTGTTVTPVNYHDSGGPASFCVGGTALTCFSPSVEGTVANYRPLDIQLVAPSNQWVHQFPLAREPGIDPSQFVRVRVTAPVAVFAYTYVLWEE